MEKTSNKVKSDLLLNMKDIESFKDGNNNVKQKAYAMKIDESLAKYNKEIIDALEAPVPPIALHYNEVLLRAVPAEIKARGGIILGTGNLNNFAMADKLTKLSHAVSFFQEILMVGPLVSDEEKERGIRPGRVARIKLDRYRALSDDALPGMIETSYNVPKEMIDGFPYLIMDKRDIMYTRDEITLGE